MRVTLFFPILVPGIFLFLSQEKPSQHKDKTSGFLDSPICRYVPHVPPVWSRERPVNCGDSADEDVGPLS